MINLRVAVTLPLALAAACATPTDSGQPSGELPGTTWRLAELRSSDDTIGTVRPDDPAKYEMQLAADGSVAIRLDCNRGRGRWESAGPGQITFGPLAMTRAMCLAGSLDTRVARELGFVRTYVLAGDRLTLNMMADGGDLVWARHTVEPTPR